MQIGRTCFYGYTGHTDTKNLPHTIVSERPTAALYDDDREPRRGSVTYQLLEKKSDNNLTSQRACRHVLPSRRAEGNTQSLSK